MYKSRSGFTIVELLIVIVVIGILAAITIVAYNGVQQRAREATLRSDLTNVAKKMAVDRTLSDSYALTAAAVDGGNGLPASSGTTYQFHSTATSYCITGTNKNTSFKISDTATSPAQGGCPGDGQGGVAAITNLSPNPSVETDTSSFAGYLSGSIARVTSAPTGADGSASLKVTPAANTANSGFTQAIASAGLTVGKTYTVSFYVYRTSTVDILQQFIDNVGTTTVTVPANTWTLVSRTFVYSSYQNWGVRQQVGTASPIPFYIDKIMFAEGGAPVNYADGSTPNWTWNGTQNNSTSTGPAI